MRVMRVGAMGVLASIVLAAAVSGGQVAATTGRLASVQVVTSTMHPPVLKLIASGPIAFQVLPADASGAPVGPDRVVARLYGIAPGDISSSFADLAPFVLSVTAEASANGMDTDTLVTIATGAVATGAIGSASDRRLVLRAGMKSNEIEAAIVPVQ